MDRTEMERVGLEVGEFCVWHGDDTLEVDFIWLFKLSKGRVTVSLFGGPVLGNARNAQELRLLLRKSSNKGANERVDNLSPLA